MHFPQNQIVSFPVEQPYFTIQCQKRWCILGIATPIKGTNIRVNIKVLSSWGNSKPQLDPKKQLQIPAYHILIAFTVIVSGFIPQGFVMFVHFFYPLARIWVGT